MFFYALQSLLQDISSHQRMVDSVVEKAQGVLQATNNPEVAAFITETSSRYEHIARTAKVTMIKWGLHYPYVTNLAFANVNHIWYQEREILSNMYSILNDMKFWRFLLTYFLTGAHETVRAECAGPPAVPWCLPSSGGLADPNEGQI